MFWHHVPGERCETEPRDACSQGKMQRRKKKKRIEFSQKRGRRRVEVLSQGDERANRSVDTRDIGWHGFGC